MKTVIAFFKTYLASLIIGVSYFGLIHDSFESGDVNTIIILVFLINLIACIVYFIGVLLPFHFLFRPFIASINLREAINKYLIYFSMLPATLFAVCIYIGFESVKDAIQFSMLLIDLSGIVFLGFIYSLKNKILA